MITGLTLAALIGATLGRVTAERGWPLVFGSGVSFFAGWMAGAICYSLGIP